MVKPEKFPRSGSKVATLLPLNETNVCEVETSTSDRVLHLRSGVSYISARLIAAARRLGAAVNELNFALPVAFVYNPLLYARDPHEAYLRKFGSGPKRVIFLGMNPGPFGMVQTGVPFGQIRAVRDWMKVTGTVKRPVPEHPRRQITGFACRRSEVSGERLWGLFAQRFGQPKLFFAEHIVMNYCPLALLESSGRNRPPDKLSAAEKIPLFALCDEHLRIIAEALQPEWMIGIGDFAAQRAKAVFPNGRLKIGRILHPSPANPAANRDWSGQVTAHMKAMKVWNDRQIPKPDAPIHGRI